MTVSPLMFYGYTGAQASKEAAARLPHRTGTLRGTWLKDPAASDQQAMARALDCMRLGGIQKHCALKLITGLEVTQPGEDEVELRYLTESWVIKHFKLSERFAAGRETQMSRRDKRSGQQKAVALRLEPDELHVAIRWDGQLPGRVEELYRVTEAGQLEVLSTMQMEGAVPVVVKTVYKRAQAQP